MTIKKILIALLVIIWIWFLFFNNDEIKLGPGVFAPSDPIQTNIQSPKTFEFKGYTITPLAKFHIKGKVLSRRNYNFGKSSKLSPIDLAMGWGRMSDESIIKDITVNQRGRWYFWKYTTLPIPSREIETHSANMHIIPATKSLKKMIKKVKKGNIVEFSGFLVKVTKPRFSWKSSTSREDTGNHSCEVVYVDTFQIRI